ncbi:MAG: helix-turn-helix transcriptional regulator, partial [Solobacterium sp.]|nr:helix-turn-helix transcriptional regulator [Solobacterium sp.]
MNRLPEKLSTLRKHFGYPQGDIAKHLDVQVTEYMNWENGNSLPDILILKRLADLFHVSLDSLVNNRIEVTLPDLEGMSTMLNIPFISTNGLREEEDVADNILPVHAAKPYETLQQDSVSSSERTAELTKTESLQETEVVPIEPTVTEVIPLVKEERKESKPKLGIYAVAALALLFILAGIYILLNQGGSKDNPLVVSDVNRLAETTNGTIFIKDDGSLETWGRVDHLELLKDIVQISSYDNHMVALYKDGRIFTSSNDTVSRSWKNNIMVAAGNTHVVALGRDKKVSCSGVSAACKVDTWKNIEQIYAGDNITAGIDNN